MLQLYWKFTISLVITLVLSALISSALLFGIGYLYGQNRILSTDTGARDDMIKASTVVLDHVMDMERNDCFSKRVKGGD